MPRTYEAELADFKRQVAKHEMQIILDDGVHRHIRFKAPGTYCMHFDLVTWPGYLCYSGDMGCYVFTRLPDMFQFFRRRDNRESFRPDLSYWAEKLVSTDLDGVKDYCPEKFVQQIERLFADYCEDMPEEERAELRERLDDEVLTHAHDGEYQAITAALEFTHPDTHTGRRVFPDFYEVSVKVWTHRFLWCCWALEWAISVYDASKAAQPAAEVA